VIPNDDELVVSYLQGCYTMQNAMRNHKYCELSNDVPAIIAWAFHGSQSLVDEKRTACGLFISVVITTYSCSGSRITAIAPKDIGCIKPLSPQHKCLESRLVTMLR
jgi:hypothetical protein